MTIRWRWWLLLLLLFCYFNYPILQFVHIIFHTQSISYFSANLINQFVRNSNKHTIMKSAHKCVVIERELNFIQSTNGHIAAISTYDSWVVWTKITYPNDIQWPQNWMHANAITSHKSHSRRKQLEDNNNRNKAIVDSF